jgi:ubiquinone/menaquinone biosynthesis C-methylase UbiE
MAKAFYDEKWHQTYGMDFLNDPWRRFIIYPFLRAFCQEHNMLSDMRIADIGCGNGALFRLLSEFDFKDAIGFDINENLLSTAQQEITDPRIKFHQCDLTLRLNKAEEDRDIVFSNFICNDIPNIMPVLENVNRLLKPGGTACIFNLHPLIALYYEETAKAAGTANKKLLENDGYFDRSRSVYVIERDNVKLNYYQKTFSDYVQAISSAGLQLTDCREFAPDTKDFQENHPEVWAERSVPRLLFLQINKPSF